MGISFHSAVRRTKTNFHHIFTLTLHNLTKLFIMNSTEKKCCNCQCHQTKQVPVTLRDTFFQDPIFSRSWDEFDQMRREMIAESRQAWTKFDEEMKKLETKSFAKSLNIETNIGESNNPTPAP